jgi:hypothetical protein
MDASLFVSDTIHERTVTLADGTKHVLHFREVPAAVFRQYYRAEQSEDDAIAAGSMPLLIAASLCDKDGKPAITFEKASTLKVNVMTAIFTAILDVNGFNSPKKDSPSETQISSGM